MRAKRVEKAVGHGKTETGCRRGTPLDGFDLTDSKANRQAALGMTELGMIPGAKKTQRRS